MTPEWLAAHNDATPAQFQTQHARASPPIRFTLRNSCAAPADSCIFCANPPRSRIFSAGSRKESAPNTPRLYPVGKFRAPALRLAPACASKWWVTPAQVAVIHRAAYYAPATPQPKLTRASPLLRNGARASLTRANRGSCTRIWKSDDKSEMFRRKKFRLRLPSRHARAWRAHAGDGRAQRHARQFLRWRPVSRSRSRRRRARSRWRTPARTSLDIGGESTRPGSAGLPCARRAEPSAPRAENTSQQTQHPHFG